MNQPHPKAQLWGALAVVAASVLWGTTGTAATFAPTVSPLAIGAVAMGLGGLLQALYAARHIRIQSGSLLERWRLVSLGAVAVAVYPLAFYSSMHLSGVAVGTVVSIGSAPLAAALIERFADRKPLSRQWILGPSWEWAEPPCCRFPDTSRLPQARARIHGPRRRESSWACWPAPRMPCTPGRRTG